MTLWGYNGEMDDPQKYKREHEDIPTMRDS